MKPFGAWIAALYAFGGIARVLPLLDPARRMQQWPTEDGYFMLTMGRNVALGHGLSVAGGEMPTNGTQPLTTFVWALGYLLVGPEREPGVVLAQVLQIVAAAWCAFGIYRLGRRVWGDASWKAWLASAVWFASPVVMPHTMNCLETGFYACVATWIAWLFLHEEHEWSVRRVIGFGFALGVCFWIRNDAAFLILAICLVDLWRGRRERLPRILAYGTISVLVASPWLIFNYTQFGHLMPVSGRAEALTGHLNIAGVPIVLAEYLMAFVAIPHSISEHPAVVGIASAGVVVTALWLWRARERFDATQRRFVGMAAIYVVGLSGFYGLYFGAAWFLPRYFAPTSPLLVLATVAGFAAVWAKLEARATLRPKLAVLAALGVSAIVTLLAWRQWAQGDRHAHFQVVAWVDEHVGEDEWVGAIQTGTLGFFHDRTVNLDGKVNIAAYEALVAGREGEYVVEDTEIRYLADWVGMRDWLTKPAIAEHFELIEYDPEQNLAVLRRVERVQSPPL